MSRDDEIMYASVDVGGYTYQAINQDAALKEWMIRKVWDGGWDEFGILTKDDAPDPSYWAGPRGGSMDGTIMSHTTEEAIRLSLGVSVYRLIHRACWCRP